MAKKNGKRDIFGEMMEGVEAMKAHREGKVTLRTHKAAVPPAPQVTGKMIRETREQLAMSQGVFASLLRVNPRTLQNWEQDRSKPNDQASALILMVREYPDTLDRLRRSGS